MRRSLLPRWTSVSWRRAAFSTAPKADFDALNYPTLSLEAGDLSGQRGQQADYAASLNEYADIDSNRLLIEAEPINKRLDQSKHGLGQVKDWLEKDKFQANLSMAIDDLQWVLSSTVGLPRK